MSNERYDTCKRCGTCQHWGKERYTRDGKVFGECPFEFLETHGLQHRFRTPDSVCERPDDYEPKEES